jgi:hypothetical protein
MTDEVLEQEFYEQMLDMGLDRDSAREATADARDNGMFDVPGAD